MLLGGYVSPTTDSYNLTGKLRGTKIQRKNIAQSLYNQFGQLNIIKSLKETKRAL